MEEHLKRLSGYRQINTGILLVGVCLALGSILMSGWALSNDDVITGVGVLIYVLVGGLLAGIGISSPSHAGQ